MELELEMNDESLEEEDPILTLELWDSSTGKMRGSTALPASTLGGRQTVEVPLSRGMGAPKKASLEIKVSCIAPSARDNRSRDTSKGRSKGKGSDSDTGSEDEGVGSSRRKSPKGKGREKDSEGRRDKGNLR